MARLVSTALIFILPGALFAQGGRGIFAHNATNDNKPYDKHDLRESGRETARPVVTAGAELAATAAIAATA